MEKSDLMKRAEDLSSRCERRGCVTNTSFLTPAEQYELRDCGAFFNGGSEDAERKIAFFLPEYFEDSELDLSEYISAVKIQSFFGTPGHRDYLGSIIGLGIKREWIGDISVVGDCAYVYCLPSVKKSLLNELSRVGRISVKTAEIPLDEVPKEERKVKTMSFTVKSLRLDAVTGDLFRISRETANEAVKAGLVSLNYSVCLKADSQIKENDVISFRGKGKGKITEVGGKTKKDRMFVSAEVYV